MKPKYYNIYFKEHIRNNVKYDVYIQDLTRFSDAGMLQNYDFI